MLRLTWILLAALATTGCLKDRSATTIRKDGSGTFTQVTTIDMEKAKAHVKALKAQARGLGLPPEDVEPDVFAAIDANKRAAALKKRKGIRITRSQQSEDAKKKTRTYELGVAFDSLQALYSAGVLEDVSVKLERVEVKKNKAWKLTIRHVFDGNDREPLVGEAAEQLRALRTKMLKRYEALWGTMEVTSTLTLPTPILAANGVRSSEEGVHRVSWRIGFRDLADAGKLVQQVTFEDAEGLKLKPFELSANDIANAIEEAELEAEKR